MKLKDRHAPVVGGLYYIFKDTDNREFRVNGYNDSWFNFMENIRRKMHSNNVEVPANLQDYVEDQICSRQPPGVCRYEKKIGDMTALGIHQFARMIDQGALSIGLKTNLESRASNCPTCPKRREYLNIKGQKIVDGVMGIVTGRTYPKPHKK